MVLKSQGLLQSLLFLPIFPSWHGKYRIPDPVPSDRAPQWVPHRESHNKHRIHGNDRYVPHHSAQSRLPAAASTRHNRSLCDVPSYTEDYPTAVRWQKMHREGIPLLLPAHNPRQTGTAPGSPRHLSCQMPHKWEYPR